MRRLLTFALVFTCISCLTEEGADPGKSKTFFRYFNGGYDDQAQAFDETPDGGFIILATTQLTDENASVQNSKIKIIKTDRYGNKTWQTLFPSFTSVDPSYYKGRGIIVEKDGLDMVEGYTIVGDSIDAIENISYLYVQKINSDGASPVGRALKSIPNVQGVSIVRDGDGYLVLGTKSGDPTNDMVLARLFNDLTVDWVREYGSGKTTHITGLFNDSQAEEIFWGGTVTLDNQTTDIRFVKTKPDQEGVIFAPNIGEPTFNEETGSICYSSFGPNFHIVGTTDVLGSRDIIYKRLSTDGFSFNTVIIGDDLLSEEGNAICTTKDEGTIIIASAGLNDESDYYLIKLNYFGETMWSRKFGSEKADRGVSVKQISDGSYVVLGSTTLGGRNTIMLTKRNSIGNIE
jgi:hypothetical protein